jgi:hypothetical protein
MRLSRFCNPHALWPDVNLLQIPIYWSTAGQHYKQHNALGFKFWFLQSKLISFPLHLYQTISKNVSHKTCIF